MQLVPLDMYRYALENAIEIASAHATIYANMDKIFRWKFRQEPHTGCVKTCLNLLSFYMARKGKHNPTH